MSITIEDISKKLGLSVSTVSKALNGYSDVAESTRARVQAAALELGYQPNMAARNLRRGRTDKLGLLVNNPITFLSDYIGDVMSGAALGAESAERNIVLYTKEVIHPEELQRICRAREVDGLMLIFDPSAKAVDVLRQEQMPFVVYGRRTTQPDVSYIGPDNFDGALQLTRHLIEQGHQRIGFTTRPALNMTSEDRFAGYKRALEEANIPFDADLVIKTQAGKGDGGEAMRKLLALPAPPTALFAFYDLLAADALEVALESGLRVPEDFAIAGFDGLKLSTRTRPTLTTVRQPLGRMGQQAIEMLMARIADNNLAPVQKTMPVELIIRDSTMKK